jgi:hypothetical protein
MPRALASYSAADWRRLRPLTQYYKELLYRLEDRLFSAKPPAAPAAFAATCARLAGRPLAITIAYNSAAAIEWQIRFCAKNLRGAALVVIDNSSDRAAAGRIEALCREAEVAYVRLRHGPADPRGSSRSHAAALNWAYRRLVRRLRPPVFAFIDHDCYPLLPVELPALVAEQPIYGRLANREHGWYLWPGFCVFRWSEAAARRLDFRSDLFAGLDTGGAGWRSFYRHLDPMQLRFARHDLVAPAEPPDIGAFERIDDWLHIGNMSEWRAMRPGREAVIERLLLRALADPTGTLESLVVLPPHRHLSPSIIGAAATRSR